MQPSNIVAIATLRGWQSAAAHVLQDLRDRGLLDSTLVLRDVEGLSAAEVAEVTKLSVAAVKSRLHRARVAVRTALAPELGVEPTPPTNGCPRIVRLFSRHLEGEIDPDECARMETHLAECPRCRQSCDSLQQLLHTCRSSPLPEVPAGVQEQVREGIRTFLRHNS